MAKPTTKPTVTQLRALANQVADEISGTIEAKQNKVKASKEYKADLKRTDDIQEVKVLRDALAILRKRSEYFGHVESAIERIKEETLKAQYPVLSVRRNVSTEAVLNDLLVASITSDNIEQIKKQVVNKFLTKAKITL